MKYEVSGVSIKGNFKPPSLQVFIAWYYLQKTSACERRMLSDRYNRYKFSRILMSSAHPEVRLRLYYVHIISRNQIHGLTTAIIGVSITTATTT